LRSAVERYVSSIAAISAGVGLLGSAGDGTGVKNG
jgi:hypothetical protein